MNGPPMCGLFFEREQRQFDCIAELLTLRNRMLV